MNNLTIKQQIAIQQEAKKRLEKYLDILSIAKYGGKISGNYFSLFIGDISDFIKIYNFINESSFNLAWGVIAGLDTEAAERVLPIKMYNILQNCYES